MAHGYKWTKRKYADILAGNTERGIPYGLRDLANGFRKADGYDLRKFDNWTPTMRRRIRDFAKRVEILTAQPKTAIRVGSEKKRRMMQKIFHDGVPSREFKVVFYPSFDPTPGVLNEKQARVKFRFFKDGISEVVPGEFERVFIPFNQKELAKRPVDEITRAALLVPGARMFFVSTGENATLHRGMSLNPTIALILKWMEMYDGKKPLPQTSGNRGDDPKHHHWKVWLNGLIGFKFPHNVDIRDAKRMINKGLQSTQKIKQTRRNYMRRTTEDE